jgi:hypothetical protein
VLIEKVQARGCNPDAVAAVHTFLGDQTPVVGILPNR